MFFCIFISCVVTAGAINIREIEGSVDIADSAFIGNQAQLFGGRIIFFDNDNDNDNDNDTFIHVCSHTLKEQIEWTAHIVAFVV